MTRRTSGALRRASSAFDRELVELVQPPEPHLFYLDLEAAREQLGLPDDADARATQPSPQGDGISEEQIALFNAASPAFTFAVRPGRSPLADAIDTGQVSGAASSVLFSRQAVSALRTGQAFDEVATALEGQGYRRDGSLLVPTGPAEVYDLVVGDGSWVRVEGSWVRVEVTYDPTPPTLGPVGLLGGDLDQHVVYRCPEGG